RAWTGDGAARLHRDGGLGQTGARGPLGDDAPQLGRELVQRRRGVLGQVADAETAAEVEGGDLGGALDAELVDGLAQQAEDAPGGDLEAVDLEDLRDDVRVQADQTQ